MNITGLNGCSCHPFSNWKECDIAHRQTFKIGQPVKQRHTGNIGEIFSKECTHNYYWIVKYGPLASDKHLEHSAQLIKI